MTRRPLLGLTFALGLIALLPCSESFAQTTTAGAAIAASATPTTLRLSLVGRWSGALGYRDYQTDAMSEIPVTTTIEALPDGVTLIRRSLFDDGPSKPVWITTVSLDDVAATTTTSASFRKGNAVEPDTETMRVTAFADPTHWSIVYASVATDGDGPAEIRVTETLDGDTLTSVKTVRPVGADETAWRFRNQTRLTRLRD